MKTHLCLIGRNKLFLLCHIQPNGSRSDYNRAARGGPTASDRVAKDETEGQPGHASTLPNQTGRRFQRHCPKQFRVLQPTLKSWNTRITLSIMSVFTIAKNVPMKRAKREFWWNCVRFNSPPFISLRTIINLFRSKMIFICPPVQTRNVSHLYFCPKYNFNRTFGI